MKNLSMAKRYARALYQLAQGRNETDDVQRGLSNLAHELDAIPRLVPYFANPIVKPEDKQAVVSKITSNKLILRFVYLLAKRKRMDLLPLITDSFRALVDEAEGIRRVFVRTPMALSEAQKKQVETDLARKLGGTVVGRFDVAKELLGGIWVKMGDKVLDATVRGRMDDLRHALLHSTN